MKRLSCRTLLLLLAALSVWSAQAGEDAFFEIGPRREIRTQRAWFAKPQPTEALYREALDAARMLAGDPKSTDEAEVAALKSALTAHADVCTPAFLWLMDWNHCTDPAARRGAVAALSVCEPSSKVAGKTLGLCAVFEPDSATRKAELDLIKKRADAGAKNTILATWKSSFDNTGIPTVDEDRRKAAVAAMRDLDDKQVFQALIYYATLEIRAGEAALVRTDSVSIRGNGVNLPIDLPVLDLVSAEGTIVVPALSSLKQASGQDFGRNLQKWNEWVGKK